MRFLVNLFSPGRLCRLSFDKHLIDILYTQKLENIPDIDRGCIPAIIDAAVGLDVEDLLILDEANGAFWTIFEGPASHIDGIDPGDQLTGDIEVPKRIDNDNLISP